MAGILKVDKYQDFNGNDIMTSDGSGNVTLNNAALKNTPAFLANLSSTQSLSNDTNTTIIFDTEVFDTDSGYDTSTGIFTVPSGKGGKYLIGAYPTITATTGATIFRCLIAKNGTSTFVARADIRVGATSSSFAENTPPCTALVDLSAGDTVRAIGRLEGGTGTLRVSASSSGTASQFFGYKLIGV
jgi:hypothetical protein